MSRLSTVLVAAASALAMAAIPAAPAGSATSCVAWASLPSRVSLAGQEVVVRATLHATPECQGVTADNGATATLNGPGPSTSDFPLRWSHIGSSDSAPFYASLNALGSYRIRNGDLQTYDARYLHIPYEWRTTETVVKYAGRFVRISQRGGTVRATLQYYAAYGWESHSGVAVHLQRRAAGSAWHTVATHRSRSTGRVVFRAVFGDFRLVSATTDSVWSARTGPAART